MQMEMNGKIINTMKEATALIKQLNQISTEEAIKIGFLLSEIQNGYMMTLYPKQDNEKVQVCHISYKPLHSGDKKYSVIVEELTLSGIMLHNNPKHTNLVNTTELMQILLHTCIDNTISLSMDFDWDDLDIELTE